MAEEVVASDDVRCPAPRGLLRTRLTAPLLDTGPDVGLVTAPAGAGKSTLLAHVAAAAAVPVAWCRASGGEGSAERSLRLLARALAPVADLAEPLPRRLPELVVALDARLPDAALLVLDDLHELSGTAAERLLEEFVQARPRRLRVLLGTRRPPDWDHAGLLVSERLVHVGGDDLRFRSWEVERLFRDVYREPLQPEAASALASRTGGWAAGLTLFHLSTTGKPAAQRSHSVAELAGRSRLVRAYLARNVLADLPETRLRFLTRTAALGVLTGPLCDAALETSGSQELLEQLEQDELFTSSHDDGRSFRYHEVLQSYLEFLLEQELGADGCREWYSRCAGLLEGADLVGDALHAHARAEDWDSVARLVRRTGRDVADAATSSWEHLLPPSLRDHDPWLVYASARRLLRNGQFRASIAAFRRAESLFEEPAARERCRQERSLVAVWLPESDDALRWSTGHASDHWSSRLRAATRRCTDSPRSPAGRPDLAAGLSALLAGRFRQAAADLTAVGADPRRGVDERCAALLGSALTDLVLGQGLDRGVGAARRRLEEAALTAAAVEHVALERLARGALAALQAPAPGGTGVGGPSGLAECEREDDPWGAALLALLHGAAALVRGDEDPAPGLDAATDRFHRLDAPVLEVWARALTAVTAAALGEPRAAELAREAEAVARDRGVRGAQCLGEAVLAATAPPDRLTAHLRAAAGHAEECGLALDTLLAATGAVGLTGGEGDGAERQGPARCDSRTAGRAPPRLEVQLLGGFQLRSGDDVVRLDGVRPRARMLLRLLALHADGVLHREQLVEWLWPGVPLAAGLRSLQVAVSGLRQALEAAGLPGGDLVQRSGDAYGLLLGDRGGADTRDVERALASAAAARAARDDDGAVAALQTALARYGGELLPEDGPAEWVVAERERLRLAAAQAAVELAQLHRSRGHLEAAAAAARRSVTLDPWQERAWRLLAALHDAMDDRVAAAHVREEHSAVRSELGLAPEPPPPVTESLAVPQPRGAAPPPERRRARA